MLKLADIIEKGILFDSHSHFSDISISHDEILRECESTGVEYIVDVSTDSKSLKKVLRTKASYKDKILVAVGVHPEVLIPNTCVESEIKTNLDFEEEVRILKDFFGFSDENKVDSADLVGECGLDYFQLDRLGLNPSERAQNIERQKHLFKLHLEIASQKKLPITIHSRASESDTLKMLENYLDKIPLIILHSFTGTVEEAQKAREMGIHLGINGIITYKSAENVRLVVKTLLKGKNICTPKDLYSNGFLLETDSPLLMPRNIKTKETQNTPARIKNIWDFVYNLLNEEKNPKTGF